MRKNLGVVACTSNLNAGEMVTGRFWASQSGQPSVIMTLGLVRDLVSESLVDGAPGTAPKVSRWHPHIHAHVYKHKHVHLHICAHCSYGLTFVAMHAHIYTGIPMLAAAVAMPTGLKEPVG